LAHPMLIRVLTVFRQQHVEPGGLVAHVNHRCPVHGKWGAGTGVAPDPDTMLVTDEISATCAYIRKEDLRGQRRGLCRARGWSGAGRAKLADAMSAGSAAEDGVEALAEDGEHR